MSKSEIIAAALDKYETPMLTAERYFWNNPQLGFGEWKTHEYLKERFTEMGLTVVEAGDITGLYVDIDTGRPGPCLCILGEMDALPVADHPERDKETNAVHACAHNCQSAALIGIAGALSDPRVQEGLCGKIRVMAVPAEELVDMDYRASLREQGTIKYLNGKMELLRRGFFEGVDASFYIHTLNGLRSEPEFLMEKGTSGIIHKHVSYFGKSGFGSPNALFAACQAISAINALRERYLGASMFMPHVIIDEGGQAVNVTPSKATLQCQTRAATYDVLQEGDEMINRAFAAGALSMGAQVRISGDDVYLPHNSCDKLDDAFLGMAKEVLSDGYIHEVGPLRGGGGSDFGNISAIMPTTYGFISGPTGIAHSADYEITHPEWAVLRSARLQVEFACSLLSGQAEKLKEAVKDFEPIYPSAEALMEAIDAINIDCECIKYEDGGAAVDWMGRSGKKDK